MSDEVKPEEKTHTAIAATVNQEQKTMTLYTCEACYCSDNKINWPNRFAPHHTCGTEKQSGGSNEELP